MRGNVHIRKQLIAAVATEGYRNMLARHLAQMPGRNRRAIAERFVVMITPIDPEYPPHPARLGTPDAPFVPTRPPAWRTQFRQSPLR